MLYCPPYSQVNHKNEFIVRVSSIDDEWLRPDWEKYNFYGDMSHHWYGDLPDSATYSNGAAHNSKLIQYYSKYMNEQFQFHFRKMTFQQFQFIKQ